MSSLAGAGAGAAEGLQNYLVQLLREEQLALQQKQQEEIARHNKSTEDIQMGNVLMQAQNAAATRSATEAERLRQNANQLRDDERARLDDLLPGVMLMPETRNSAVQSGAASPERFGAFDVPRMAESSYVSPEAQAQDQQDPVGYFLRGEQKQQGTQANLQRTTMLVDGKPTDVMVDPRPDATSRVFTMQGEDVTKRAQHYERPRAEPQGFQVVQSDNGYSRFNRGTGNFEKLVDGQWVMDDDPRLATTQATRSMQEGATMIRPHVAELSQLAMELNKRGLFGPVMGRIRDLAAKFGTAGSPEEVQQNAEALSQAILADPQLNTDRLVGQFATALGLMTSGMGRVHGGARGGGSIQMITYLKSLLSGTTTPDMFLGRLDSIDSYLKTYERGPAAARQGEQAAPSQDQMILEELRRLMQGQQPR